MLINIWYISSYFCYQNWLVVLRFKQSRYCKFVFLLFLVCYIPALFKIWEMNVWPKEKSRIIPTFFVNNIFNYNVILLIAAENLFYPYQSFNSDILLHSVLLIIVTYFLHSQCKTFFSPWKENRFFVVFFRFKLLFKGYFFVSRNNNNELTLNE